MQISQNSQENTKKRFCYRCFLVNSAKLFGRLLLHKHSLCLLSYHDLSPFQKRCRIFFLAEYFFGLICRLGTKVSSICKTLSQKPIFNLVKHLGWSFSCEKFNSSTPLGIFAKKAPLYMVNHGLKAPL